MAEGRRRPSPRFWISVITAACVVAIVWGAWPTILEAIASLRDVNPWILALVVPCQLASYAITGEVLFSFLRARGELRGMHPLGAMRMSLEFNFANHMLPSGGAAGIAYTSWKLSTFGVPASRATIGQLAKFAVTFASFSIMLAAAALWLLIAGDATPGMFVLAGVVGALATIAIVVGVVLLRRRRALHRAAGVVVRIVNAVRRITRREPIDAVPFVRFVDGAYREVRQLTAAPRTLAVPFLLSFLVNALDAGLFLIALWAFGIEADPAIVFIAYGIATVASMVIATPNGVGPYELVFIGTLVGGGMAAAPVTAAIVVLRAILLIGTIVLGWGFYQHSVARAGAPDVRR